MMYAKLALRNVKRSAKDYLIYVITLILSVGLFYGFMSIASPYYNESLPVKINLEILNKAMRIAVPIVALLVVFLISYVNTYMLRRKQKEFAVQTIIGMEQRTVAFIFFVETMIMGAISIIFGILLGIGLSQIVGYIVVQSFGGEWQPYLSLFPDTILFTLLFFGAIFIVMGIRNIRTVRQLKIIDIFQNYNLVPILNVYENIVLPVELDGDTVDQKFLDEIVHLLGLEDKLKNMPNNLSGGQQQRVAIARALITKPAIVLADEPTGNLDSKTSAEVLGLIKRTSAEFRQTVVMITHNNDIARLADRIIRIEDGKIVE